MVLKFGVGSKLVLACGVVLFGAWIDVSTATAQSGSTAEAPFVGFRPFGSGQSVSASGSVVTAGAAGSQAQSVPRTTINPQQPALAYPYPASGSSASGALASSRTGTAERASLGGRLSSTTTPTGSLNRASNSTIGQTAAGVQATAGVGNVDPALWQRYQQELQQQQTQQQYQQYQQWLAQQQQYRAQRQSSSVGFRSQQAPTPANPANNRAADPVLATRSSSTSTTRTTTARLNQAVVQQVSSTTTGNRDSSVARADWSSSVAANSSSGARNASTNSTSVSKQATSVANSVAKPQCCCVPQNCCVAQAAARTAAPTTPAPLFRPQTVNQRIVQAANQVPTLNPNVASTYGGFLGQSGANYQVQPQGGYQFQSGLGVPQFQSTGASGSGWFSNGLFGTGAYTPLLPLASAQGARLGQGIIGQPTAYMDGQPLRNLLRYLSP